MKQVLEPVLISLRERWMSQVSKIAEDFAPPSDVAFEWGDRRQEIVFIGIGMSLEKITALLDSCLLTESEMAVYRAQALEQAPDVVGVSWEGGKAMPKVR